MENTNRKQVLIACAMLTDELRKVYEKNKSEIPIIWMKRGYHNNPSELRTSLQQIIDEHQDCDTILLSYGMCGNGTVGLVSEHTKLVIPRYHDCINQLLRTDKETGHLYMTRCWTLDREAMKNECYGVMAKYGQEQGTEILKDIYGAYSDIDVIDTDSYDMEPVKADADKVASLLGMQTSIVPGSTKVLEKLLSGDWDEEFIIHEPGEIIMREDFF